VAVYFIRSAGHAGFTYRVQRALNLTGPPAQAFYRTAQP